MLLLLFPEGNRHSSYYAAYCKAGYRYQDNRLHGEFFPVLSCFAAVVDSTEPGSPISVSIPTALSSGALTLSGSEVF